MNTPSSNRHFSFSFFNAGYDDKGNIRDINMEKVLKQMFDYQKFYGNSHLEMLINDTESRYGNVLCDDELEYVNAAGDFYHTKRFDQHREDF